MDHYATINVHGVTADDVTCHATARRRGYIDLGSTMTIHGTIAELRAVAVEIDRQLARLEVEHRIDQAVTKCGTCDGGGEVAVRVDGEFDEIGVCPDCGGSGQ